jgi:hypothetical protein
MNDSEFQRVIRDAATLEANYKEMVRAYFTRVTETSSSGKSKLPGSGRRSAAYRIALIFRSPTAWTWLVARSLRMMTDGGLAVSRGAWAGAFIIGHWRARKPQIVGAAA